MRDYPFIPEFSRTGLLLFGAAFCGRNDGQYFDEAGLHDVDVVDTDAASLVEMEKAYPQFGYIQMDAFDFIHAAVRTKGTWDVVSVDPFTNLFSRVADEVENLLAITNKMLVIGGDQRTAESIRVRPHGAMKRSAIAWWLVYYPKLIR